jgi:hypothetical protein
MRLRLFPWLTLLLVGIASLASAYTYLAYEQVTVANTAIGFTTAKITPGGPMPTMAQCRLETAQVRWTIDGVTAPTTTVGTLLEVGDAIALNGHDVLVNFRAIRTGGSSGVLNCTYSTP